MIWAADGGALAYVTDRIHVVTHGGHHRWLISQGARLAAISSQFAVVVDQGEIRIFDVTNGVSRHRIDFAELSISGGESAALKLAISGNSQFLLVDQLSGEKVTTSVTDLTTMKSRLLRKRQGSHGASGLFVADSGACVLQYGHEIDYIKADSRQRRALFDPELLPKLNLKTLMSWLYRLAVLAMALLVAGSMSAAATEARSRNQSVLEVQFHTFKAIAILLVPGLISYVVFLGAVTKDQGSGTHGIMSPSLGYVVIGCFLLFVVVLFARIAARMAGFGMRLALAMKAKPEDAAVVVPVVLAGAFLFVPALASVIYG